MPEEYDIISQIVDDTFGQEQMRILVNGRLQNGWTLNGETVFIKHKDHTRALQPIRRPAKKD